MDKAVVKIKISRKTVKHKKTGTMLAKFGSNIQLGDVLQYIVLIGEEVAKKEYYQVEEVGARYVCVKWKEQDIVKRGQLSYKQLMGDICPAPKSQVRTHFNLIKNN